jgi:acetolactate synthase I/II/III large subunit
MKLAIYVFEYLKSKGIDTVFLVTGGGAMHLNDAIGRVEGIKFICNHNEQASAIAAEGYARVTNKPAVVNVTAGPGGINALNGVFGAFTDSIPMLIISGQAKRQTMLSTYNIPGLRQLGDQELDIISMVKNITKYSTVVSDPSTIKYDLEKALHLATSGRPGPCWLDIPVDVQGTLIDETTLKGFDVTTEMNTDTDQLAKDVDTVIQKILSSERPAIIASTGIRLANAIDELYEFAELCGIPVTTAWTHDVFDYYHPLHIGKQGTIGDRAGNFAVQNADLVLMLGSRMAIRQVSYNWENFARMAYKVQVDIDGAELIKPTIKIDLPLQYDVKLFLQEIIKKLKASKTNTVDKFEKWVAWCIERKIKYPVLQQHHKDPAKPINPYYFLHSLHEKLNANDIIVCGDATACIVTFQTSKIKKGQLLFSNSGCASMGYDVPAAIGAAVGGAGKRIICIAGDGSIQMNIQELQTIVHHQFNIKLFVMDNDGYLSIKSTQNSFFKLSVGSSPASGVSFPDMERIGHAYNIPSFTLKDFNFQEDLQKILDTPGPVLCNVKLDAAQLFEPKLSSKQLADGRMVSAPLEDMFPFLSEAELKENMIIPLKSF